MSMAFVAQLILASGMCVAASSTADHGSRTQVTPIQKVLDLMKDMAAKGEAMKKEEAVKYSAFAQWCGDQTRVKTNEIADGKSKIEKLEATIEKLSVLIAQLTDRIAVLDEDVGRWEKDMKSTTYIREKEKADFTATSTDYTESIDALTQAVTILKKQSINRPQAELMQSLLQVQRQRLVPAAAKKALASFLQQSQPDERLFAEAPEAYGYEFQSGGVVDMLEKLQTEFSTKKGEMEMEETKAQHAYNLIMQQLTDSIENAQHAYNLIMQQLTDSIENAKHEISRKEEQSGEAKGAKAEAEGDLAQTTQDMKEDETYLSDMTAMCEQKKMDFESRQKLRGEEIEAIEKAIEILASNTVAGAGERHLPSLIQKANKGRVSALALLRSERYSPAQQRVAALLSEAARRSGSRLLADVSRMATTDPFTKVKKMIKDLIVKLMEEATAEMEHKGWCDAELATNKVTREARTSEVDSLSNEIDGLTSDIATLTDEVATLTAAIKELDKAMAEATKQRAESKAANDKAVKEAKEAQVAVEQALAVLKEFYAKAAQATAFVQQSPAEDAPETFDKAYTGMMPEGGNIVDFLEVVLTDFARLESETASAEVQEADAFDKFMFESKKDKALKENEIKHKEESKTNKESALVSAQEQLKLAQEQLEKAVAYYEKLKPSCVDSGINYEDRVRRREEEMQSLQEALKILSGQDIDLS